GTRINSVTNSAREALHAMAGNQHGDVWVAWLDLRSGKTELWGASSHDSGKSWNDDVLIYRSPDGHICECCHPSVQVERNGTVQVMWRNWLGGARDMYVTQSTDGGRTFKTAEKIGSGTWLLNACPMDGGSISGPYFLWRREKA